MRITMEQIDLKEILQKQTKSKLMDLTYKYPIKGKSKLKKDELVNALHEIMTMEETIRENAIILAVEFNKMDKLSQDKISKLRKVINLGYGNIISTDEELKFIVPKDIDHMFSKIPNNIEEDIKRYTLIRTYLLSCIRFYGAIEINFFIELFNNQNIEETPLNYEELKVHIMRCVVSDLEIDRYADCIVSNSLLMFEGDIEDLMSQRQNKDFYVPSKEELLKYEDEFYVEKNSYYISLENFIYKKFKNKELSTEIAEELTYVLRFDEANPSDSVNEFNRRNIEFDSIKDLEKYINLYINLANNTRTWANKGYTPKELSKNNILANSRNTDIGRNDTCPCGSGKKYKKCCLN